MSGYLSLKKIPRCVNSGDKIHVVPLFPVHSEASHDVGQLLDEPLVVPGLAHPVIACIKVTSSLLTNHRSVFKSRDQY